MVNSERGISPFAMVYLIDEDVVLIQQYHKDLINVSLLSTSKVKATRTKLISSTSIYSEVFIIMLKIFADLIFPLFYSS